MVNNVNYSRLNGIFRWAWDGVTNASGCSVNTNIFTFWTRLYDYHLRAWFLA